MLAAVGNHIDLLVTKFPNCTFPSSLRIDNRWDAESQSVDFTDMEATLGDTGFSEKWLVHHRLRMLPCVLRGARYIYSFKRSTYPRESRNFLITCLTIPDRSLHWVQTCVKNGYVNDGVLLHATNQGISSSTSDDSLCSVQGRGRSTRVVANPWELWRSYTITVESDQSDELTNH